MHLGKILMHNAKRLPPKFYDFSFWTRVKDCLNDTMYLEAIITHWIFELIMAILILLSFINTVFLVFMNYGSVVEAFDYILLGIFGLEIIVRMMAVTPAEFFEDIWNKLDAFFVFLDIGLEIFLTQNPYAILKFFRIFRIANFFGILSNL